MSNKLSPLIQIIIKVIPSLAFLLTSVTETSLVTLICFRLKLFDGYVMVDFDSLFSDFDLI